MYENISEIVPTYNSEKTILNAAESVIAQTCSVREIIIVDDGSTDRSLPIIENFHPLIVICSQKNKGPASARNHGEKIASGQWIAFLDSDDTWNDDKLGRLRISPQNQR